jgi:hypothetical protein
MKYFQSMKCWNQQCSIKIRCLFLIFDSIFCYHLKIKIRLNIIFHFQTNDQIERQNQTLKQYLKIYVNYQQNNWIKLLFVTKFAYNNNWHNVIKMSSFTIYIETKMSQNEKIKFKKILKRKYQQHDSKF